MAVNENLGDDRIGRLQLEDGLLGRVAGQHNRLGQFDRSGVEGQAVSHQVLSAAAVALGHQRRAAAKPDAAAGRHPVPGLDLAARQVHARAVLRAVELHAEVADQENRLQFHLRIDPVVEGSLGQAHQPPTVIVPLKERAAKRHDVLAICDQPRDVQQPQRGVDPPALVPERHTQAVDVNLEVVGQLQGQLQAAALFGVKHAGELEAHLHHRVATGGQKNLLDVGHGHQVARHLFAEDRPGAVEYQGVGVAAAVMPAAGQDFPAPRARTRQRRLDGLFALADQEQRRAHFRQPDLDGLPRSGSAYRQRRRLARLGVQQLDRAFDRHADGHLPGRVRAEVDQEKHLLAPAAAPHDRHVAGIDGPAADGDFQVRLDQFLQLRDATRRRGIHRLLCLDELLKNLRRLTVDQVGQPPAEDRRATAANESPQQVQRAGLDVDTRRDNDGRVASLADNHFALLNAAVALHDRLVAELEVGVHGDQFCRQAGQVGVDEVDLVAGRRVTVQHPGAGDRMKDQDVGHKFPGADDRGRAGQGVAEALHVRPVGLLEEQVRRIVALAAAAHRVQRQVRAQQVDSEDHLPVGDPAELFERNTVARGAPDFTQNAPAAELVGRAGDLFRPHGRGHPAAQVVDAGHVHVLVVRHDRAGILDLGPTGVLTHEVPGQSQLIAVAPLVDR